MEKKANSPIKLLLKWARKDRFYLYLSIVLSLIGCSTPFVICISSKAWIAEELSDLWFLMVSLLPLLVTKLSAAIFVDLTSYKNLMISKRKTKEILEEKEETGKQEAITVNSHEIIFNKVDFSYVQ